jgi:hypothetical protein
MIRQTVLFGTLVDLTGANGVWATNGTAAGTYELTGFSTNFLDQGPGGFTTFDGEVFYDATDVRWLEL